MQIEYGNVLLLYIFGCCLVFSALRTFDALAHYHIRLLPFIDSSFLLEVSNEARHDSALSFTTSHKYCHTLGFCRKLGRISRSPQKVAQC